MGNSVQNQGPETRPLLKFGTLGVIILVISGLVQMPDKSQIGLLLKWVL